jgi:uncharacterized protein YkwD
MSIRLGSHTPRMPRLAAALGALVALIFVGTASAGGIPAAGLGAAGGRSLQAASSARVVKRVPTLEERLVAAINAIRLQNGLAPLRLNAELAAAAREHSVSMARLGYFEHSSATGKPFWYRIKARYPISSHYWSVGENLAWATPNMSAHLAVELWLRSPPHRRVMLGAAWRDIGIGGVHVHPAPGVYGGGDATILTADFGVRR